MKRPLTLALSALFALASACSNPGQTPSARADSAVARGIDAAALFASQCALCHGAEGRGDGSAAPYLYPQPRDFTREPFRYVSSRGGPSDADLDALLVRGIPGSAMPSFAWTTPAQRAGLAGHVRELALRGGVARAADEARAAGADFDARECEALVRARLQPAVALDVGLQPAATPALLERGRELFLARCAACHGVDGKGPGLEAAHDSAERLLWARDFTGGALAGGSGFVDLARRVALGIPGTPMGASSFERPDDLGAVVAYVASLLPAGASERLVQRREVLRAARVEGGLPAGPNESLWRRAEEIDVALAPLEWDSGAPLQASISALHDGRTVSLRVRWQDATHGLGPDLSSSTQDGAALAFSDAESPPVFGMGNAGHPVNLWHWRAEPWANRAGVLDLLEASPHARGQFPDGAARLDVAPLYLSASLAEEPTDEVRTLRARGSADVRALDTTSLDVRASATWADGEWCAVFSRPLRSTLEGAMELRPARGVELALALWQDAPDGSTAHKSVTLWHRLLLDP